MEVNIVAQQNTIAIIWDFDKTLINGYMQDPLFEKYHVDSSKFWAEVTALQEQYAKQGIKVNKDTIYLNHFLTCVKQGVFPGLNNRILTELGSKLTFYPGVPNIMKDLQNAISTEEKYRVYGIHVENYIISTGLTAMIRGSKVMDYIEPNGIWGCEFIETPIQSDLAEHLPESKETVIQQIGYAIDNTSKTRALFEINKGTNKHDYIDVNSKMDIASRRVPFEHMIYIADGPSDVPVFSILQQHHGHTFAIYPREDIKAFEQVDNLRKDRRIDMYAEADYRKGTQAYMWLMNQTRQIANRIYEKYEEEIRKTVGTVPRHLN